MGWFSKAKNYVKSKIRKKESVTKTKTSPSTKGVIVTDYSGGGSVKTESTNGRVTKQTYRGGGGGGSNSGQVSEQVKKEAIEKANRPEGLVKQTTVNQAKKLQPAEKQKTPMGIVRFDKGRPEDYLPGQDSQVDRTKLRANRIKFREKEKDTTPFQIKEKITSDGGVPRIKRGEEEFYSQKVVSLGTNTFLKPYNLKEKQSFTEKLKLTFGDYTDISKGGFYSQAFSRAFGTAEGQQGVNPIGAVTKLFTPFNRFKKERRKGEEQILQQPNQGTSQYDIQTNTFQEPKVTKFDILDVQTRTDPSLLLPPQVAYNKEILSQYKENAEELKPEYEERATTLGQEYQKGISSGLISFSEAEKNYKKDIEKLNREYNKDVSTSEINTNKARLKFKQNLDFQKEYQNLSKDVAIQPSTILGSATLVGTGLVSGAPAIATQTVIGLQGASNMIRGTSKVGGGDYKGGAIDIGLGSAMFIGGTYSAIKTAANLVTQQQIVDVQEATALQPTKRFQLSQTRYQDTYKLYGKTPTAKLTGGGDTTFVYNPSSKSYTIKASSKSQYIETTDYFTQKPLNVQIYSTTDYGTSTILPKGSVFFKGAKIQQYDYNKYKITETLTTGKTTAQYTFSSGNSGEAFKQVSKSRDFVVGGKTFYNPATKELGSISGEGTITFKLGKTGQIKSAYGEFSPDTIGIIKIKKPAEQALYNFAYPSSSFGNAKPYQIFFKPTPSTIKAEYGGGKGFVQSSVQRTSFNSPNIVSSTKINLNPQLSTRQTTRTTAQTFSNQMPIIMPTQTSAASLISISPTTSLSLIETTDYFMRKPKLELKSSPPAKTSAASLISISPTTSSLQKPQLELKSSSPAKTLQKPKLELKSSSLIKTLQSPQLELSSLTNNNLAKARIGTDIFKGGFPPFALGGLGVGGGSKRIKTRARYGYTPDYTSLVKGIKGKRTKGKLSSGKFAGFESRPVTENWITNLFKKKRNKR